MLFAELLLLDDLEEAFLLVEVVGFLRLRASPIDGTDRERLRAASRRVIFEWIGRIVVSC